MAVFDRKSQKSNQPKTILRGISQVSVRKLMLFKISICVYPLYFKPQLFFEPIPAIDLHLLKVGKSLRSQDVSPPNSLMAHYLSTLNLVTFFFFSKPLIAAERKNVKSTKCFVTFFFSSRFGICLDPSFRKLGKRNQKITQKVGPQNVCRRKP